MDGSPTRSVRAERAAYGKSQRRRVPRSSHAVWEVPHDRDPIAVLVANVRDRLPELVPIHFERMVQSPLAFYRGSAAIMANDLASTPQTGISAQICGDAHLSNFGSFATPERRVIFDVNDFDESLAGPWEFDVKRLAAGIVLAGRDRAMRAADCARAVRAALVAYRTRMREFAAQTPLEVWFAKIEEGTLEPGAPRADVLRRTEVVDGRRRFVDSPPLIYHPASLPAVGLDVAALLESYRARLRPDIATLLARYEFADAVIKVVGVGSAGMRCFALLLIAGDDDALILQVKEAVDSVLQAVVGAAPFAHQGERVVYGQRMMQAASDLFLGAADCLGRDYYVRQLRDAKTSADLMAMTPADLAAYAWNCGCVLAAAHARSGDAISVSGYLGIGTQFDEAVVRFARAYADQVEKDFETFRSAASAGKIPLTPPTAGAPSSPLPAVNA